MYKTRPRGDGAQEGDLIWGVHASQSWLTTANLGAFGTNFAPRAEWAEQTAFKVLVYS